MQQNKLKAMLTLLQEACMRQNKPTNGQKKKEDQKKLSSLFDVKQETGSNAVAVLVGKLFFF